MDGMGQRTALTRTLVCASWWFPDTVLEVDRDGNAQCEHHRPRGPSRGAQVCARGRKVDGQLGSVRCHRVAAQNRSQQTQRSTMGEPIGQGHTQRVRWEEPLAARQPEQIRSNAQGRERGAAPNPDEGSKAIGSRFARIPDHRACENTTDLGLVRDLHRRERSQMSLDADTGQAHPRR